MKSAELNDWLQVIGLFGVIASLIFVGLQLRQDRQIALAEVITAAGESSKYWAELLNNNADLWAKGISGEKLTRVEIQRFDALADAYFLRWQAAWTRASLLEPSLTDRFAREAAMHIHTNPGLQSYWSRRTQWQKLLQEGESDTGPGQWTQEVEEQLSVVKLRVD